MAIHRLESVYNTDTGEFVYSLPGDPLVTLGMVEWIKEAVMMQNVRPQCKPKSIVSVPPGTRVAEKLN